MQRERVGERRGWARRARRVARWVQHVAPRGGSLSDLAWRRRHRGVVIALVAATLLLLAFGPSRGIGGGHVVLDVLPSLALAGVALLPLGRRVQASTATMGLLAAAAVAIHFSGGATEAHFAVFVVLGVITLYQDWVPFGIAVSVVTLHHAVLGALAPHEVFANPAAVRSPLTWAAIHGAFVTAATVANLVAWKASENQAMRDDLTGLPNRLALTLRIDAALARGLQPAVLVLDLSGFKRVNDLLGHAAGDHVLHRVARRLMSGLRRVDLVARIGGDVFAVLLPEATREDAEAVARRIVATVAAPLEVDGQRVQLTGAVGVALGSGEDATTLLRDADGAMYAVKRQSQAGGYLVSSPEMQAEAGTRRAVEGDLALALDREQLELHYQPIVEMGTGRLRGFEALVRWNHPVWGLVPPCSFIPIAEETGLIVPIGAWVLRTAAAQLAVWRADRPELDDLSVSVNVSTRQLARPDLARELRALLDRTDVPADALVLEITESALMGDDGRETVAELARTGARVALDDFGTGYSSLSYLARLPIDVIKIDKSFTDDVPDGPNAPLLAGVVALAHRLGKLVVVEGVECTEQATALLGMGATVGQGYLYSRPVPVSEAAALVAAETERRATPAPPAGPPAVLVVEDDEQLARSFTRALAQAGCHA